MTFFFLLVALWLAPGGAIEAQAASSSGGRVIFYDPDAKFDDLIGALKAFDSYFSSLGHLQFQAVQQSDDFEAALGRKDTQFVIVSSTYLRSPRGSRLTPLLVPAAQGDAFYRKLLVSRREDSVNTLSGKNIASTGVMDDSSEQSKQVMSELARQGITRPLLMSVPKDVDALLALYFRQVQGALVTPGSIEVLKHINPQATASFQVLFETKKMLRSPFCVVNGRVGSGEQAQVTEEVKHMDSHDLGRVIMQRLEFDAWLPFRPEMLAP